MKQKEYFGYGSISNLKQILGQEQADRIFLITDKNAFEASGAAKEVEKQEIPYSKFSRFSPNPKIEDIEKGFEEFKREKYWAIVAIGGGSSIDVAKSIKLFHFNETDEKIPLIAVPTTSGSGSEATYFIVYYVRKEKQSKGNPVITLPDYAILDPSFTMSLPQGVAASTGLDALAQAIESYWCINATEESKDLAAKSIKLTLGNLEKAVNNPDKESRKFMMLAANLAGHAINITKTTAPHSIAYPITSHFGIPHGHAAALTLAEMLEYNAGVTKKKDCSDSRGPEYVKNTINELVKILGASDIKEAKQKITELMSSTGLKTRLSELGLQKVDLALIVKKGFTPERVKNNPRILTEDNLRKILNKIY